MQKKKEENFLRERVYFIYFSFFILRYSLLHYLYNLRKKRKSPTSFSFFSKNMCFSLFLFLSPFLLLSFSFFLEWILANRKKEKSQTNHTPSRHGEVSPVIMTTLKFKPYYWFACNTSVARLFDLIG